MKTRFLLSGLLALSIMGCSTRIINTTQDFSDLEKEYKSFSTKALSDAYVKRMFGKYLSPVNTTQLTRQLEFSRYLKSQSDNTYETSLKSMFSQTPVLYDQMTGIGTISNKMSTESATFGTYVIGLSPYALTPVATDASNITQTSFKANWNTSARATGYKLFVNGSEVYSGASTSFDVTGLTVGTTYTYYVKAVNNAGTSGSSNTISVILNPAIPGVPTTSAATSVTTTSFTANWISVSGATSYKLKVDNGTPTDVGLVTSYNISGLTAGTTHTYSVQAVNSSGTSAKSLDRSVTLLPATPVANEATTVTSSSFTVGWNSVPNATSYKLYIDGTVAYSGTALSYNKTGLTSASTHTYYVQAINTGGASSDSSTISITLLPSNVILVKANATGLNNGTSWTNAYTSLQSALSVATSGKDIWIASGTYKPGTLRSDTFQLKSGVNIYGGFTGNESVLSQRNFNNNIVILSGDINGDDSNIMPTSTTSLKTDNSYHVVTGENNSTLDGVTVKFAYADGSGNDSYGGGMRNIRISQTINNVIFSYNYALCGGGMYNDNATDTNKKPILTNVIFSYNNAYSGGGIGNYISNPILTNVIFFNNSSDFTGGGLYNEISSPIVTNATFSNNTASYGGGIYNYSSSPTVTNATFSNNTGTTGGGMYSESSSTPTVRNSIFWISPILNYSNSSLIMGYSDVQGGFSAITGGGSIQNLSGTGLTSANFTTVGHNINSNPIFVNASDLDGADNILRTSDDGLYLQSGSPARNTGTNTEAPASDIIGTSRPKGIGYDMGAYEFIE